VLLLIENILDFLSYRSFAAFDGLSDVEMMNILLLIRIYLIKISCCIYSTLLYFESGSDKI